MSRVLSVFVLLLLGQSISGMAQETTTYPEKSWLPGGNLFDPLYLDPYESQFFGSFVLETNNDRPRNRYVLPFGLGLNKGIFRKDIDADHAWELRLEGAAFTVFEWAFLDSLEWQRNLVSTDYKAGYILNYRWFNHTLRFRLWHVSSHLGDDYMIRYGIFEYSPDPINYEQLDVTYARESEILRWYAGAGAVVRPETIRKRWSLQAGILLHSKDRNNPLTRWTGGVDVKSFAQTDYRPNFKVAAGLEVGKREAHPVRFLLEFYDGHTPYSIFEDQLTQWLGIGLYTSL